MILILAASTVVVGGVVLFRHHLYFGPPLPEGDAFEEWRQLGAEIWGVDTPGEWAPVVEVIELMEQVEADVIAEMPPPDDRTSGQRLRFALPEGEEQRPEDAAFFAWQEESCRAAVDELRRRGVFDRVRALPSQAPVWDGSGNQSIVPAERLSYRWGSPIRRIARALKADLQIAIEQDDPVRAVEAMEAIRSLSSLLVAQPSELSWLVWAAIEPLGRSAVTEAIVIGTLTPKVVEALARAEQPGSDGALAMAWWGEILLDRWLMSTGFDDSVVTRWDAAAQHEPMRFALEACIEAYQTRTYEDAVAAIDDAQAHVGAWPKAAYWRLRTEACWFEGRSGLLRALEQHRVTSIAHRTVFAIERFRLEHGEHPESLRDLVPRYLSEEPRGVGSPNGLVYQPGDPRSGDLGYILYSVGRDATDHFGVGPDTHGQWGALGNVEAKGDVMLVGPDGLLTPSE